MTREELMQHHAVGPLCDGKVVLITGAASGIGRSAATMFCAEGASVMIADLNEGDAESVAAGLREAGGTASSIGVDVADEDSVKRMVEATVSTFGQLDCAFNNAGINDTPTRLVDMTSAQWQRMIQVNLTSVFLCMKYEVEAMLKQPRSEHGRGAIVNTSSGAGYVPAPGMPHYTAAKHGVLGLTKYAAKELFEEGIRVNALCPGGTDTPMMDVFIAGNSVVRQQVEQSMPGGRMAHPQDVAAAAVWLCSDRARWIAGESLLADGGSVAH